MAQKGPEHTNYKDGSWAGAFEDTIQRGAPRERSTRIDATKPSEERWKEYYKNRRRLIAQGLWEKRRLKWGQKHLDPVRTSIHISPEVKSVLDEYRDVGYSMQQVLEDAVSLYSNDGGIKKRGVLLKFQQERADRDKLKLLANRSGLSLSAFIRNCLIRWIFENEKEGAE